MKTKPFLLRLCIIITLIITLSSCSKEGHLPDSNGHLKQIKQGDYIVEEISYNFDNIVSEVNSTSFYRKFYYDKNLRLIREDVAISPLSFSSSIPSGLVHEFVDPDETGISMYHIYEYDANGRLVEQLNYIPGNGADELRSKRTFEYNENNLISKELLLSGDGEVTQFRTYLYDSRGNVIEEDYYTYLFITSGPGPRHLSKFTYEYDSFNNPYKIFEKSCQPGINTNTNNIVSIETFNYQPVFGVPNNASTKISYEYNYVTGYPTKVVNGEEFIYQ